MAPGLPELRAGVYRHYKGHHYLVLGYAHDANHEGRSVVVYVGLELDGARHGERMAVRTVEDFFALVNPKTGAPVADDSPQAVPRFTYVAATMTGSGGLK